LSHGELKQWNTSVAFSNTFQACHAVFLPFPTNADTVSQSVNAHQHFIIDVVTKEEHVVSNKAIDTDFIAPCTHEEADTRMFLHAKHAAIGGRKSITLNA
jgi:hypothetical protein